MSTTWSEFVFVALFIQHAMRVHRITIILSFLASLVILFISILFHKRHDFRRKVFEHKMLFDFLYKFYVQHFFILKRIHGRIIINLHRWKVNVKWSRYRPGVALRVGRGIALLFIDRGTRRGWVVSSTPRPHFIPGKDQVPISHEAGWATGPLWMDRKSRPHRDSIPNRPASSQSLYRLSYRAHKST